jgi:DNA-binding NtrC family response regulator
LPGLPPSSPPALVVLPNLPHLLVALSALTSLGFDVKVAETFKDAKATMAAGQRPALLLTDIRLREYNGLHLVLRGKSTWPALSAIVTSEIVDPTLQHEAEAMGATFVLMPTAMEEIIAAVLRTVLRRPSNGVRPEPIRPLFERRRSERRVSSTPLSSEADRRRQERRQDPARALRELMQQI